LKLTRSQSLTTGFNDVDVVVVVVVVVVTEEIRMGNDCLFTYKWHLPSHVLFQHFTFNWRWVMFALALLILLLIMSRLLSPFRFGIRVII
jgi:hypothetical protein